MEISHEGDKRRPWVLYAARGEVARLVVFLHGFNSSAVGAWHRFEESGQATDWWRESDMLFVGYDSWGEHPEETATWFRERIQHFYPVLPDEYLSKRDSRIREPSKHGYHELVLVGHSLGGFVLRLALCLEAGRWIHEDRERDPNAERPVLLDGAVRLFSPASAGFQPAGLIGMLKATCLWSAANVALRRSPAFIALERGSELITTTRARTEDLVNEHGKDLVALRAHIVWARPENVVERQGYEKDHGITIPKVCIPSVTTSGSASPARAMRSRFDSLRPETIGDRSSGRSGALSVASLRGRMDRAAVQDQNTLQHTPDHRG